MATVKSTLFSWDAVEARSDLDRFFLVRDHLPDNKIIEALEQQRQKGRNDFPIVAMWNALIAGIVFQHASIESLRRELSRNPALLAACGFDPLPLQKKPQPKIIKDETTKKTVVIFENPAQPYIPVPNSWNFSRFLQTVIMLEEKHSMISQMIKQLREELMNALPDFGKHLGFDGKAIESYSTGHKNKETQKTTDPDADWGKHKTSGIDAKTGQPWGKIKSWFGYSLHLIADTQFEIPVSFHITPASWSEQTECRNMIKELFTQTPTLAQRCEDFAADRGLDSAETKKLLWDEYKIRPLIDIREMWREEKQNPDYDPTKPITRPLFPSKMDTIVYTEKGTLHCVCPKTGEVRDLAFQGFESDRNTLKYRCPAQAYGFTCPGQAQCHRMGGVTPGDYGRIVRINLEAQDRRIFVPTPYKSPAWNRGYNRRSALERINNRIDNSFCFEKHYIRGMAKMKARAGLALAVMMAMALGHIKSNRMGYMRSLIKPIPHAA